jgi:hypothetical protein
MREIVFNYEEYKRKVNSDKPIHHCGMRKPIDKHGLFFKLVFRIYGVNRETGNIIIYENLKTTFADHDSQKGLYQKFAEKYAKPLGSTEGALTL